MRIKNLLFADDIITKNFSVEGAEQQAGSIAAFMSEMGAELNTSKTDVLIVRPGRQRRDPDSTVTLPIGEGGEQLLEADSIKYLGAIISEKGVAPKTPGRYLYQYRAQLDRLLNTEGIPAALLMAITRAKAWAAVSYGLIVDPPIGR